MNTTFQIDEFEWESNKDNFYSYADAIKAIFPEIAKQHPRINFILAQIKMYNHELDSIMTDLQDTSNADTE